MKATPICVVLALCTIPTLAEAGPQTPAEDEKLTTVFREYLDADFRQRPLEATRLGDHRFDHLLDDVSPKARAAWIERTRDILAELPRRINYKKLSRGGQIDLEIWRQHLERNLWLAENTRPFEEDPRTYNDYITESVYLLLTQSTLPARQNVKHAVARIAEIPRIVAAAKETLKKPPKVFVETAIRQNRGAIGFYHVGMFDLVEKDLPLDDLRMAAKKVVPVLKEYQQFLQDELLPRAEGNWRLGKTQFAKKFELEMDAGITSEEVLKEAEAEADRVEAEMYVIARQLWAEVFPGRAAGREPAVDPKPLPPDD